MPRYQKRESIEQLQVMQALRKLAYLQSSMTRVKLGVLPERHRSDIEGLYRACILY